VAVFKNSSIICPILYNSGKIYFGTSEGEIFVINDPDISSTGSFRNNSIWPTFQEIIYVRETKQII